MAISPRDELRIEALVVFAHFSEGWVWAERALDGSTRIDSSHKSFDNLREAILDFFEDESIDLQHPVDATDAHYSKPIQAAPDEWHIRKYAYGAPNPIQVVA